MKEDAEKNNELISWRWAFHEPTEVAQSVKKFPASEKPEGSLSCWKESHNCTLP
jgi:hypothetical protein